MQCEEDKRTEFRAVEQEMKVPFTATETWATKEEAGIGIRYNG